VEPFLLKVLPLLVPMVVKTDFTDGHCLGMGGEGLDLLKGLLRGGKIVEIGGMDAYGGEHAVEGLGDLQAFAAVAGFSSYINYIAYVSRQNFVQTGVTLGFASKPTVVVVGVGVEEGHLTR
jgi:hypothetical protein